MLLPARWGRYAGLATRPQPDDPLARRDPAFIRGELGTLGRFTDLWFAPEVDGLDHLEAGPALVVGTHNGGNMAPDMFAFMVAFWRRFGVERAAYGLAHDRTFDVPLLGPWMYRIGAVPARPGHARALLARGATVLVYPGGDVDAYKPFAERHVVKFGERAGFIRTAAAAGVPVVPVISVGAHETFRVLTDGRWLARAVGFKRLTRVEVLPIALCLPFGLSVGPFEAHLPAPSKVRIRVLPPIDLGLPPDPAEGAVRDARERVREAMQTALDGLVREGDFGPRARLRALGGRPLR